MKTIRLLMVPVILILFLSNQSAPPDNLHVSSLGRGQMPSLTKDQQGNLHLVYGIGDSLLYRYSKDKGHSFSQPQLITRIDGLLSFATRGPQIAATKNGVTIVASTEAGNMYAWSKTANGRWGNLIKVNDVDSSNLEGFVALTAGENANLFATWLDLRENKRNKIYGSRSDDGGRSWKKNILVYASPDSTVCECCKPSVAMNGNKVYVMFRNWLKGNRDLHVIESLDGGRSFGNAVKLGNGTWPLKGCPMDGGAIALNKNGNVETVWRREKNIYACEAGKPEVQIGEGKGCTLENIDGKNVYAWTANGEIVCALPGGKKIIAGKGNSPVLKTIDNHHFLLAWENNQQLLTSVISL